MYIQRIFDRNRRHGLFPVMDHMFDEAWRSMLASSEKGALNLRETKDNYDLSMKVPGLKKEDISIDVEKHWIHLKMEQNQRDYEGYEVISRERPDRSLDRKIRLSKAVNPESATATLSEGSLHISIDKTSAEKPLSVVVNKAS
jgi:HSP20 family protein